MTTPSDSQVLATTIRQRLGELTISEKQAARALLSDYPLAGLQAITAFATQAKVSPAAPPLCNTAINKGHWKKIVVKPVHNCAASRAKVKVAGPLRPGSARRRPAPARQSPQSPGRRL